MKKLFRITNSIGITSGIASTITMLCVIIVIGNIKAPNLSAQPGLPLNHPFTGQYIPPTDSPITTMIVSKSLNLAPNQTNSVVLTCPTGTALSSGGYDLGGTF